MIIIDSSEKRDLIYNVVYDEETIKILIDSIINELSVRKRGRYTEYLNSDNIKKVEESLKRRVTFNGIKIYENISDIKQERFNAPHNYRVHGMPLPYFSFDADALIYPKLVIYLEAILNGNISYSDYECLINRKEISEREELESKIQELDSKINEISNFDTEEKIGLLKKLAFFSKRLKELPNFDNEKLSTYYDLAQNSVSLELVSEIIRKQK